MKNLGTKRDLCIWFSFHHKQLLLFFTSFCSKTIQVLVLLCLPQQDAVFAALRGRRPSRQRFFHGDHACARGIFCETNAVPSITDFRECAPPFQLVEVRLQHVANGGRGNVAIAAESLVRNAQEKCCFTHFSSKRNTSRRYVQHGIHSVTIRGNTAPALRSLLKVSTNSRLSRAQVRVHHRCGRRRVRDPESHNQTQQKFEA